MACVAAQQARRMSGWPSKGALSLPMDQQQTAGLVPAMSKHTGTTESGSQAAGQEEFRRQASPWS